MVFRKSLLAVAMSAALIPAAYAMEGAKADAQPAPAVSAYLDRATNLANKPADFILDFVYNLLHSQNPIASDDYLGSYPVLAKYGRAIISIVSMYYIATNEKAQQTVANAANQAVSLTKRVLGVEKKGVCTKSWNKDCGACPKTCGAGK